MIFQIKRVIDGKPVSETSHIQIHNPSVLSIIDHAVDRNNEQITRQASTPPPQIKQ